MDPGECRQVAIFGRLIRCVLESHGNGTYDNGQHLACRCQRDSQRNTGPDALATGDNQHGRDDGRQRGIGRNRRTDVHPAEGDHLQRTADDDPFLHITQHDTDQRTGDQRAVELKFIQHRLHTGNTGNDEHQHNLKSGNLHCTSPIALQIKV